MSVSRVTPDQRVPGDATQGLVREQAFATDDTWAGLVRTEPHTTSGWHHHCDYDTSVYVVRGRIRFESCPGGSDVIEAGEGDFVLVPKHAVHREGNPGDGESHVVVVRAGHGPAVVDVDGPGTA